VSEALGVLRRRWWVVAACLVGIPAATYVQTARQPPVYESAVTLQGAANAPTVLSVGTMVIPNPDSASLAEGYVGTPELSRETARKLRGPHPPGTAVRGDFDNETGWLTLTASGGDTDAVVAVAGASAKALRTMLKKRARRQLADSVRATKTRLAAVNDPVDRVGVVEQLRELRLLAKRPREGLQIVDGPSAAERVAPHTVRNTALAAVLALLVAPALMLLGERLDRRVRRTAQLRDLVDAPMLGSVPAAAFHGDPRAASSEAFGRIRDALVHFDLGVPLSSLIIASPLRSEGRTTVTANLAVAFARAEHSVVAVDCDLRVARLADRLGVHRTPGLAQVLAGGHLHEALQAVRAPDGELSVLPAGGIVGDPATLLGSDSMSELLDHLAGEFDLVLLDVPPLLSVSDALPLLPLVSGVVCVARVGQTPRAAVRRMLRLVGSAGARIVGSVATGAPGEEHPSGGVELWAPTPRRPAEQSRG